MGKESFNYMEMGKESFNYMETEVKFLITEPEQFRLKLKSMGIDSAGSVFEKNRRYDDLNSSLLKSKCLLRLRCDQKNILTFKKPASIQNHDFKTNEEIEVEVSNFDQMEMILKELGFNFVQAYEKRRETFILDGAKVLIDIMPFGTFIEIEGTEDAIRNYSGMLGLDWNRKITINYLQIFENIAKRLNLTFRDVTFDNFKQVTGTFFIEPNDLGLQPI